MISLSEALGKGALASLKGLSLQRNQIGDIGMSALASACANGALPKCTTITVFDNSASAEAQQAVKDAIASRK